MNRGASLVDLMKSAGAVLDTASGEITVGRGIRRIKKMTRVKSRIIADSFDF